MVTFVASLIGVATVFAGVTSAVPMMAYVFVPLKVALGNRLNVFFFFV